MPTKKGRKKLQVTPELTPEIMEAHDKRTRDALRVENISIPEDILNADEINIGNMFKMSPEQKAKRDAAAQSAKVEKDTLYGREIGPIPYKYGEKKYFDEIQGHVNSTYGAHYVSGRENIQTIDLIFAGGHGEGFCLGSARKYIDRFGKKAGYNRKDILKSIHFLMLALHNFDTHGGDREARF